MNNAENFKLQIEEEHIQNAGVELSGRRIIHMQHFLSELKKFGTHNKKFGCSLENIICENETRKGLISNFAFKCNFCHYRQNILSDSTERSVFDTNKSAVAGIMTIGGGYSALQQFTSSIDVPAMSEPYYQKIHGELSEKWQEIAEDSMAEAAAEEREAAIEEGRVDENGTPMIDVVADGCWAKRSYRTNYSSLSGTAAIIGKRFGKVLYLAVRNKYCSICEHAKRKNLDIGHKCFKNYDGSSTGMESDILVEGFKCSILMYNLIYGRIVSDGDSSTYCKILEARPYPNITVEKIECVNHLLRNFCNKMRALSTDTRFPVKFRKMVTPQRIMSIRRNIKKAIQFYQNMPASNTVKINNLHSEINNILMHVFRSHVKCKNFYCSETKLDDPEQLINELRSSGLWLRITVIVSTLAGNARSLLHNHNSNIVESFNSTVAKFIGGKRINYTSRGSYATRCNAAVLSHNTKRPLYKLQKAILNTTPSSKIYKAEKKLRHRYLTKNKYVRVKKRLNFSELKKQNDYGPTSAQPDMDKEAFQNNKELLLENLKHNSFIRDKIQEETILQREDTKWMELRRKMLTASSFSSVITRRASTSCAPLVKRLLCAKNLAGVTSIGHGIRHEKTALQQLEIQENVKIKPCGLFIDKEHPFLGATPDGLIEMGDMIVEVKCPITAYKMGLEQAIENKKIRFWTVKNGNYNINKNHQWFCQVQGQLHVTNKRKCLFAVWSGENKPLKIEYIERDDEFWQNKMASKLVQFYLECLLPEIVDSRIRRNLPVREPDYIKEAIEKKNKEKPTGDKEKQQEEQINKIKPDKLYNEENEKKIEITKSDEEKENNTCFNIIQPRKLCDDDNYDEGLETNELYYTNNKNIVQGEKFNYMDHEVTSQNNKNKYTRHLNFSEF